MLLFTFISLICLVTFRFRTVTSSHWIVAENGKIQAQLDSVYHMRAPHDLMAFLNQEKRVERLEEYYDQMLGKVSMITKKRLNLDGVAEIESKLYTTDQDCLNTYQPLNADDLSFSFFDDGKDLKEFELLETTHRNFPPDLEAAPECSKYSSLEFSMAAFPHLKVLAEPWSLEDNAVLEKFPSDIFKLPEIGKILNYELSQNQSSWFHYNLAAIYWRKKGKPNEAIECAKRAVHYSSRQYKDVSLLNLGSLLRYNEYLMEAAIVIHAALDHAPRKPLIHFTLANVYLFLGDFNRSIVFYDNVLHLQPNLKAAQRIRHFVGCNWKHQANLKLLRDSLNDILHHSHEYQELQLKWLKLQEELLSQVVPFEFKLIKPHQDSISSFLMNKSLLNKNCGYNKKDGKLILKCDYLPNRLTSMHEKQLETKIGLQVLANNALSQILKINEKLIHFSIEPPQLNSKASTHQLKNIEDLQLPIRSFKNKQDNKVNSDSSDNTKKIHSVGEDLSHVSLNDDDEDDDGKLELLLDENESFSLEEIDASETDEVSSFDSRDSPFITENDKSSTEYIPNSSQEMQKEKRNEDSESSSGLFTSSQQPKLSDVRSPSRNIAGNENFSENPKSVESQDLVNDLIQNIKENLKNSIKFDDNLSQSDWSVMFHNYMSNLVSSSNKLLGSSFDWSVSGKTLGRELEVILKSLKSSKSPLSDKILNSLEKIDSEQKCSQHLCPGAEETDPLSQVSIFSLLYETEERSATTLTEHFRNVDLLLDVLSHVDISPNLLSFLKTSKNTADTKSSDRQIIKCQPSENEVPDLTVSSLTEGKSMMPEPKLLKVFKIILNSEDISTNRLQKYIGKILKDSTDVWSAATVAALFWRYSGNAENTVACLQQAVSTSPKEIKHSPLQIVSYILLTIGHPKEALFLASLAIQLSPHSLLSHLTLYKIFSSAGDQKKAQIFRSSSLALLASYNPNLNSS